MATSLSRAMLRSLVSRLCGAAWRAQLASPGGHVWQRRAAPRSLTRERLLYVLSRFEAAPDAAGVVLGGMGAVGRPMKRSHTLARAASIVKVTRKDSR